MFDNVGKKIKVFAKVLFGINILLSVVFACIIMSQINSFLVGAIAFSVSFFAIWLIALFVYGFGKLIENSDILVEQGKKSLEEKKQNEEKE